MTVGRSKCWRSWGGGKLVTGSSWTMFRSALRSCVFVAVLDNGEVSTPGPKIFNGSELSIWVAKLKEEPAAPPPMLDSQHFGDLTMSIRAGSRTFRVSACVLPYDTACWGDCRDITV